MSTTLPNIGLVIPASGDSDYPTSIQTTITNTDNHDHSSGKGLPVKRLHADAVDGTTLEVSSNVARIKDLGVSTAKLAANAVTKAKLAALTVEVSSSTSTFSTSSTTFVDVTNATVDVDVSSEARPVLIMLVPDGGSSAGYLELLDAASSVSTLDIQLLKDASVIAVWTLRSILSGVTSTQVVAPCGMINFIDIAPTASTTHTYKLQAKVSSGDTGSIANCKLIAVEL